MTTRYDDAIARHRREHGNRFSDAELAAQFVRYYNTGQRIRVRRDNHVRTGTIGMTTGWRPAFLLMHRSNAISSWDLLTTADVVEAVKIGRQYQPV